MLHMTIFRYSIISVFLFLILCYSKEVSLEARTVGVKKQFSTSSTQSIIEELSKQYHQFVIDYEKISRRKNQPSLEDLDNKNSKLFDMCYCLGESMRENNYGIEDVKDIHNMFQQIVRIKNVIHNNVEIDEIGMQDVRALAILLSQSQRFLIFDWGTISIANNNYLKSVLRYIMAYYLESFETFSKDNRSKIINGFERMNENGTKFLIDEINVLKQFHSVIDDLSKKNIVISLNMLRKITIDDKRKCWNIRSLACQCGRLNDLKLTEMIQDKDRIEITNRSDMACFVGILVNGYLTNQKLKKFISKEDAQKILDYFNVEMQFCVDDLYILIVKSAISNLEKLIQSKQK